jgi:hypothetical protein
MNPGRCPFTATIWTLADALQTVSFWIGAVRRRRFVHPRRGKDVAVSIEPDRRGTTEPPTSEPAAPRVRLKSAEPRIFGVVPPALALVLGIGALIVGIVVLGAGAMVAGVIWLAAGIALLALALDASRRWPASALPRLAVKVADGTGRRAGLARVTAGAWGGASRRVVALRRELRSLRGERDAQLIALGEAAHREDEGEIRQVKDRLRAIDERIATCESEMEEVISQARERVRKEKVAVRPTEQFAVAETPPPAREDEPTRTAPTARRPASPRGA